MFFFLFCIFTFIIITRIFLLSVAVAVTVIPILSNYIDDGKKVLTSPCNNYYLNTIEKYHPTTLKTEMNWSKR